MPRFTILRGECPCPVSQCPAGLIISRLLVLSVAVLLVEQASPAAGPVTSLTIAGQLSGGNNVSAACTVSNSGQVSGTGSLYGTNPINGHNYSYGFYINKLTTAPGKIILSGKFAINGYPVDVDSHGPWVSACRSPTW